MADIIITSYFTNSGLPTAGLTPTIRIWEVTSSGQSLVIGATNSSGTDGTMTEIIENGESDGFYRYTFSDQDGYDPTKCYAFRVDGGSTQDAQERYQVGELNTTDNADALVDLIYDEPSIDHINTGSFGEIINQVSATANTLLMDLVDVRALLELGIKYQANKTTIDPATMQLTIFDNDCVTPLRTFRLLDKDGNPSITEMCTRVPIGSATTDGHPTCV